MPSALTSLSTRLRSRPAGQLALQVVAVVGAMLVVSGLFTGAWQDVANQVLIVAIAALGLDLVLGHTGLVSIGNAAFLGVGATTVGVLNLHHTFPMLVSVGLAGMVCAALGVLVAIPAARVSGLYLAVATLALQFIVVWLIQRQQSGSVGDAGYVIPTASIGGWQLNGNERWLIFLTVVLSVVYYLFKGIVHSKPGRALHAIREQPALALATGISVAKYKFVIFSLSSGLIGTAGALNAYYIGNTSYAQYTLDVAIQYLAIVIVGGLGSVYGALLGSAFVVSLPYLTPHILSALRLDNVISSTDVFFYDAGIVGVAVAVVILFLPGGLVSLRDRIPVAGLRRSSGRDTGPTP